MGGGAPTARALDFTLGFEKSILALNIEKAFHIGQNSSNGVTRPLERDFWKWVWEDVGEVGDNLI